MADADVVQHLHLQQQQQPQQLPQPQQQTQQQYSQQAVVDLSPTNAFPPAGLFGSDAFPPVQQSFPTSQFGSTAAGTTTPGAAGAGSGQPPNLSPQQSSGSLEAFFPTSGNPPSTVPPSPAPFSSLSSSTSLCPSPFSTSSSCVGFPGDVHVGGKQDSKGLRWREGVRPPPLTRGHSLSMMKPHSVMAGSITSSKPLTKNAPFSSSEDDLLSFTDVRTAAAGVNNKQNNIHNTNAQILKMYDTSQSGGQYGAVVANNSMRSELPYARTPGMLMARPQPYQIGQGMAVTAHFTTNNNFSLNNNNRLPGAWGNQSPMQQQQQLSNLAPRMMSNNYHYSPHLVPMHQNNSAVTTSHSNGDSSVPNANSLDLLRF